MRRAAGYTSTLQDAMGLALPNLPGYNNTHRLVNAGKEVAKSILLLSFYVLPLSNRAREEREDHRFSWSKMASKQWKTFQSTGRCEGEIKLCALCNIII
jgi:hypothetical protein